MRALCLIPLLTGLLDFILGLKAPSLSGGMIDLNIASDANLNSQIRFFGAIWLGLGVLLWRSTSDLKLHSGWFRAILWILILSGLGRLASYIQFGTPSPALFIAMLLELFVMPALLVWHSKLLK